MPICKKCNDYFPYTMKIDGKKRNFSNRKYCLKCSPFGQHNTKKIHISTEDSVIDNVINDVVSICNSCNKEFIFDRKKGGTRNKCGSCCVSDYRRRLKLKSVNYKGGKCICCGYNNCVQALQFHHLDPKEKDFQISGQSIKWESIKAELDKCVLVCANCHSEIHANQRIICWDIAQW